MNEKIERIKYLTRKAQRGSITPSHRKELAGLLGENPKRFKCDDELIAIALINIAIHQITELIEEC